MSTVLLVEGDPHQRLLYKMELEDEGYDVLAPDDEGATLDAIASLHPDMMVFDPGKPDPSRMRALSRIKARYPSLPLVIYATFGLSRDDLMDWAGEVWLFKTPDLGPLKHAVSDMMERVRKGVYRRA